MIASKVGTKDIRNIGAFGKLDVTLRDEAAVKSLKSLVTRTKNLYPRKDGLTYTISTRGTSTITVEVVRPVDVRRKNK